MGLRLGDVEVVADQRNEERFEDIENELVEQLGPLLEVGQRGFDPCTGRRIAKTRRNKPRDACDLAQN